jgi:hypothetical protein
MIRNSRAGRPRNLAAMLLLCLLADMVLFWMSQYLTQKHFGRRDKNNALALSAVRAIFSAVISRVVAPSTELLFPPQLQLVAANSQATFTSQNNTWKLYRPKFAHQLPTHQILHPASIPTPLHQQNNIQTTPPPQT